MQETGPRCTGPASLRCVSDGLSRLDDLIGRVVAVLLGVEPAPARVAEVGHLRAKDAADAGVTVGNVCTGDLVVAVVLAEATERRVDRRRRVAALGQPAHR